MGLSRQEIIDYASRYVGPGEAVDFPHDGELFCLIARKLPEGKTLADEEGWSFQGYGICLEYALDSETNPPGKWLWMHFASLVAFPPTRQMFQLQPPHVVKGRFQNPARTEEFRFIKISLLSSPGPAEAQMHGDARSSPPADAPADYTNIVKFRTKKT